MREIKENKIITASQANARISTEIVDGYVSAVSGGGDLILMAKVIIIPTQPPLFKLALMAAMAAMVP
ncbi:MAG: hypothetical protein Q8M92_06940, partial [Candidatus Subteraquimicrobiales bacterium]|nr:hypothetical protein [Candidatus Subteraquimicrobiales bacterium]